MTARSGDEGGRESLPQELASAANKTSQKPQAGELAQRIDATAAEMMERHAKALSILADSDAAAE
ncbi:MAG: hypothetical protein ABR573_00025 [Candidatus Dormibacteria bacterium]